MREFYVMVLLIFGVPFLVLGTWGIIAATGPGAGDDAIMVLGLSTFAAAVGSVLCLAAGSVFWWQRIKHLLFKLPIWTKK